MDIFGLGAEVMFEAAFFGTVLADRIRQVCAEQSGDVPVLEFHLADDATLDILGLWDDPK